MIVSFVVASAAAAQTLAYNGGAAASYADAHWQECDGFIGPSPEAPYACVGWPPVYSDCANYASRALHAGGYSYVSRSDPNGSWYWWSQSSYSLSWTVVPNQYRFLTVYDKPGGGTLVETTPGWDTSEPYNKLSKGDLIFFNWDASSSDVLPDGLDHVRVEAGWGQTDPSNGTVHSGDYADQHSPKRYHDFWNGVYINQDRFTTWVYSVHIDPANI